MNPESLSEPLVGSLRRIISGAAAVLLVPLAVACGGRAAAPEPPAPAAAPVDTAPTFADTLPPPNVLEGDYSFTSGEAQLMGTLALPTTARGGMPVVVIVAGSGPTDRDGNNPPVLATNTYAQIAWGLAQRGIASVRYDKRGVGESAMPLDVSQLTTDVFMEDVLAAAKALGGDSRFSRVFLLGHSEGAQLVVQAANRGAPVAGVILMSGLGRPLTEVLHEQVGRLLDREALVQFDSALARYLRGQPTGDVPAAVRPLLLEQNRRFLQSMAAYDAPAELQRVSVPIMIVHGGMDIQASDADADALMRARPDAHTLIIPEANHTMKRATGAAPLEQLPLYRDRTIPIVPELVPAIAEWIGRAG